MYQCHLNPLAPLLVCISVTSTQCLLHFSRARCRLCQPSQWSSWSLKNNWLNAQKTTYCYICFYSAFLNENFTLWEHKYYLVIMYQQFCLTNCKLVFSVMLNIKQNNQLVLSYNQVEWWKWWCHSKSHRTRGNRRPKFMSSDGTSGVFDAPRLLWIYGRFPDIWKNFTQIF